MTYDDLNYIEKQIILVRRQYHDCPEFLIEIEQMILKDLYERKHQLTERGKKNEL